MSEQVHVKECDLCGERIGHVDVNGRQMRVELGPVLMTTGGGPYVEVEMFNQPGVPAGRLMGFGSVHRVHRCLSRKEVAA